MLQEFDTWAASRTETNTFEQLRDSVIAIDASFYLDCLITQPRSKEPLLSALGGLPFALKARIENELDTLQQNNIEPLFVFNGISIGRKYTPFRASDEAARLNAEAWELYNQHQPDRAVSTFGSSGHARPEGYYRLLQCVLRSKNIPFQVAPYSAWGQMAYLVRDENKYVDAIAGSSELLLFDVDKVITKLDFEKQELTWIRRQSCVEELGLTSTDLFVDACMLSGSELLPPLPTLNGIPNRSPPKVKAALEAMKANGQTGISVCMQLRDHPAVRRADYVDRYRRSRMAVKHQIVLTTSGKVEAFDSDNAPSDLHEVIGQRLPEELYYYLSVGAVGPRVLDQLTSQEINETAPADGGISEEYRALVQSNLTPMRATTLSLLAHSLTRAYQHRAVTLRCWFDPSQETTIRVADVAPPRATIANWNVHLDQFEGHSNYRKDEISLTFAVGALRDTDFAAKTIHPKDATKLLESKSEVAYNSIWRFLHLRGYLDEKHNPTGWGKVLDATLSALPADSGLDDAAVLAVELLRFEILNANNMFPSYSGAPMRGSETDRRNTILISRVACLVRLRHKSIGFTGPLSRHLLGYSFMIGAVRTCLRDLLEMCYVTLLLNGDADRESIDFGELGLDLPFLLPTDCSLGIAMKHYLDELAVQSDPTGVDAREEVKDKGVKDWFPYAEDFRGDLVRAFSLWDAVHEGVKVGVENGLVSEKDKELWAEVEEWKQDRM